MRGNEFIKKGQRFAKDNDLPCSWHPDKGKGRHGVLTLGERLTIVRNPKDELKLGTLHGRLKQIGLRVEDL